MGIGSWGGCVNRGASDAWTSSITYPHPSQTTHLCIRLCRSCLGMVMGSPLKMSEDIVDRVQAGLPNIRLHKVWRVPVLMVSRPSVSASDLSTVCVEGDTHSQGKAINRWGICPGIPAPQKCGKGNVPG